ARRRHHRRLAPGLSAVVPAPGAAVGRRRDDHVLSLRTALHQPGQCRTLGGGPPRHVRDQPWRRGRTGCPAFCPGIRRWGGVTWRGGEHPGRTGLWLLLVSATCCAGPPLIAGLASAGALAGGGLGLALAALLMGTAMAAWLRRRARATRQMTAPVSSPRPRRHRGC